jgi:uncharacterized membrane protein
MTATRPEGNAGAEIVEQAVAVLDAELGGGVAAAQPAGSTQGILHVASRGRPGQTVDLVLGLVNERTTEPVRVHLFCTELVAGYGSRIAAERVALDPADLWLAAQSSGDVVVRVNIPQNAEPGLYAGLLRAANLDDLNAIVTLAVD